MEFEQYVLEPLIGYKDIGISSLTSETYNSLEFTAGFNYTPDQFIQRLDNGDRILPALLSNSKFEFKANLNKTLGDRIREILLNLDPNLGSSTPVVLLQTFSNMEVDLKFRSPD